MYNFFKSFLFSLGLVFVALNLNAQNKEQVKPEINSDVILNTNIRGVEKGLNLTWSLDYDVVNYLKENGYFISIKYNTRSCNKL